MSKVLRKYKLWRGLAAVAGVLLSAVIFLSALLFRWAGNVNIFLDVEIPTVEGTGDAVRYDIGYEMSADGLKSMLVDSDRHDVRTMEEGSVLLKNDNGALPLASSERRVTLFGAATAKPYYKGSSGGAAQDPSRRVSLYDALKAEDFAINDAMFDAYAADWSSGKLDRAPENSTSENTGRYPTSIGEEAADFYNDAIKNSYANDYNDVAIVMFARDAGEGADLSQNDKDGLPALRLHKQEADLLKMIKASSKFKKTVLLVNSAWAMELGYLFDEQYGIDAALWIGGPGLKGFTGVANVLVGKADPSGRLTDTYAADSLSSAAVQNSASYRFDNSDFKRSYLIQAEGIYAGYKYYETRYQDQVLDINNAAGDKGVFASQSNKWNYADEMVFPFGYGSSYAKFTQTLESLEWDRTAHTVKASVKVKYNGLRSGVTYSGKSRSVVQLYAQLPYASGMAEKSAIQLIGFGKSKPMDATDSEDNVDITVDDYIFATYDEQASNGADGTKMGCYVFDAGDYYFAIGDDCHDALNNVLAKRGVTGMFDAFGKTVMGDVAKVGVVADVEYDNTSYARSRETGNVVSNLFDNVDYNYWVKDTVTYLTRDDWNTFPKSYTGLTATQAMIDFYNDKSWQTPSDAPSYDSFTQGTAANGVTVKFYELHDLEWGDDKWETFLDQLTVDEMCKMVGEDFGQAALNNKNTALSIGKPQNKNSDGPSGAQGSYAKRYGGGQATQHVNEVVAASTFDPQLLYERGKFIACDCAYTGTTQIWGPGANLHRTPYSGRNFEYYSEDGIMSYLCGAYQTKGMQDYGTNAAIKHFAGNDQETGRENMHNFMSEQHLRQDSLKGFEGAYTAESGALSSMMSFTSYGMHSEFYTDRNVLTGVVRDEWGWKGVNITDNVRANTTMNGVEALVAGTDTFNAGPQFGTEIKKYLDNKKDGYVLKCLREANKRFFYAMSRSTLVNGLTADTAISDFVPWWQPALKAICAVIGAVFAALVVMYVLARFVFAKKEEQTNE